MICHACNGNGQLFLNEFPPETCLQTENCTECFSILNSYHEIVEKCRVHLRNCCIVNAVKNPTLGSLTERPVKQQLLPQINIVPSVNIDFSSTCEINSEGHSPPHDDNIWYIEAEVVTVSDNIDNYDTTVEQNLNTPLSSSLGENVEAALNRSEDQCISTGNSCADQDYTDLKPRNSESSGSSFDSESDSSTSDSESDSPSSSSTNSVNDHDNNTRKSDDEKSSSVSVSPNESLQNGTCPYDDDVIDVSSSHEKEEDEDDKSLSSSTDTHNDSCSDIEYRPCLERKPRTYSSDLKRQKFRSRKAFIKSSEASSTGLTERKEKDPLKVKVVISQSICFICRLKFVSHSEFLAHLQIQHRNATEAFKCDDCEARFDTNALLRQHILAGHKFLEPDSLNYRRRVPDVHEMTTGIRKRKCIICSIWYRCHRNLRRHMRSEHAELLDTKNVECDLCREKTVYANLYHLERHKQRMHAERVCHLCGKVFTNFRPYMNHVNWHEEEKQQSPCPVCGVMFRPRSMSRHMLTHKKYDRFFCELCGKGFFYKNSFEIHQDSHKDQSVKTVKCTECDKYFFNEHNMKKHRSASHSKKV